MSLDIKIEEARKMSKKEIETKLKNCTKKLENLGMTHEDACDFISGIMNLGIASKELWDKGVR